MKITRGKLARCGLAAVTAVALVAATAPAASAAQMLVTYTGVIQTGFDAFGTFGLGSNADLTGQAYTASFVYDTGLGVDTHQLIAGVLYKEQLKDGATNPLRSASVEVANGVANFNVTPGGSYFFQQELWSWPGSGSNRIDTTLSNNFGSGPTENDNSIFLGSQGSQATLPGLTQAQHNTNPTWLGGSFNRFENDAGGLYYFNFQVDVRSVTISEVPEPGAWALLLVGFGGAGWAVRRRRRVAAA